MVIHAAYSLEHGLRHPEGSWQIGGSRDLSRNPLPDKHLELCLLGPCLVSAHLGCPVHSIFGALHIKVNLVGAGKYVDGAMVDLFPVVGFITGINPTISNNFEAAPTAGAAAFHAQSLIVVGVTAILDRMRRKKITSAMFLPFTN